MKKNIRKTAPLTSWGRPVPVARGTRHATAPTVPDKARLLDTETGEVSEHWRIDPAEILRTSNTKRVL